MIKGGDGSLYAPGELEQRVELDRRPDTAKFSGRVRAIILIVGVLFSWALVLVPIWLLIRG